MSSQNYPDVIFDCDGTLVDSEILAMDVAGRLLLGDVAKLVAPDTELPTIEGFIEQYAGWNFREMITHHEKQHGITLDHVSLLDRQKPLTIEVLTRETKAVPHMQDVLDTLVDARVRFGIATSSEFVRVLPSLESAGLSGYFNAHGDVPNTFSAFDTFEKIIGPGGAIFKPQPHIYIHAMQAMDMKPEETVAIEDSPSGVMAARRANMRVVGYTGASHIFDKAAHAVKLREAGAMIVTDNMRDLPQMLKDIKRGMDLHRTRPGVTALQTHNHARMP